MAASIRIVFLFVVFAVSWPTQAQEHIGCFRFNHGNTVLSVLTQDVWSIEACIQQCQNRNATYAGVRTGFQCYCGDNHNHAVNGPRLSDINCTTTCLDHKNRCGGQFSIVIYSVCRRGRYYNSSTDEPNCDASCNCLNNSRCTYKGSCSGECEPGWSGASCNIKVLSTTDAITSILDDATDPMIAGVAGGVSGSDPSETNGLPVIEDA